MAKKSAAILLIGLGMLIALVGVSYRFYQSKISEVGAVSLPEGVAGLTLGRRIFGDQPLSEVSWRHGQEFQLNQGAVGK